MRIFAASCSIVLVVVACSSGTTRPPLDKENAGPPTGGTSSSGGSVDAGSDAGTDAAAEGGTDGGVDGAFGLCSGAVPCPGCCDINGLCISGTQNNACGHDGELCNACGALACVNSRCQ